MEVSSIIAIIAIVVIATIFFKFVVSPLLKLAGVVVLFIAILYVLKYYFNINLNQSVDSYITHVDIDGFLAKIKYFIDLILTYLNQTNSFFKK